MSSISRDDVIKLAKLSRLQLNDDEIARYQAEIESILHYVEKLQSIDTDGLEPTYQVTGLVNVMRADAPLDYIATSADLLKNAPASEDNMFKVRRMVG